MYTHMHTHGPPVSGKDGPKSHRAAAELAVVPPAFRQKASRESSQTHTESVG